MKPGQGFENLEREMKAERVSALRRIAQGFEKVLEELRAYDAETAALSLTERSRRLEARKELWRRAERQFWYLVVQREAMGLRRHEELASAYQIPAGLMPNP